MAIKPQDLVQEDELAKLSPLQQRTRRAAIALAFIGVFVWAAKILFF